jgi:hypothetical protein
MGVSSCFSLTARCSRSHSLAYGSLLLFDVNASPTVFVFVALVRCDCFREDQVKLMQGLSRNEPHVEYWIPCAKVAYTRLLADGMYSNEAAP